jgi:hypothetical protein
MRVIHIFDRIGGGICSFGVEVCLRNRLRMVCGGAGWPTLRALAIDAVTLLEIAVLNCIFLVGRPFL